MERRDYDLRADDFAEPTFTGDPASCLCSTDVVGSNTFCSLCNAWCNCMKRGCFITPDGRAAKSDNSPDAMERRVKRWKERDAGICPNHRN